MTLHEALALIENSDDIDYAVRDIDPTGDDIKAAIPGILQERFPKFRHRVLGAMQTSVATMNAGVLDNQFEVMDRTEDPFGSNVARVRAWPTFESWQAFNRLEHGTWIPWRGQTKYARDLWIEPLWVHGVDLARAGFQRAP